MDMKDIKKSSKEILKRNKTELEEKKIFEKMMAGMGIKKEVMNDNSDSAIADLLIQGVSMGSINMEKKIKDYESEVSEEELNYAKEFLCFQQQTIEELKKYL